MNEITKTNYHESSYIDFLAINDKILFGKLCCRKNFEYDNVMYTLAFQSDASLYYSTDNNEIIRVSDHWCNNTVLRTKLCEMIKACKWNVLGVDIDTPFCIGVDRYHHLDGICNLDNAIEIIVD